MDKEIGDRVMEGDFKDQRYLPRWEVSNPIRFELGNVGEVIEGRSKDLSCAGACLFTDQACERNKKVKLNIFLSDQVSVKLEGKVIWVKPYRDGYMMGIDFCNAPIEAKETILNYAFEINRRDMVKHWYKGWR